MGERLLHNGTGQYERALADAAEADRQPWEWGAQNHFHELIEAAGALRAARRSRMPQLERLAETVEPSGSDWGIGVYARSHALLSTGRAAEDLYNEAIDHLERTTIRPELARAHLLYGEWLRRENRRVDARAQLRTAYEMLTAMGIHGFAERTRRRAAGHRRDRAQTHRRHLRRADVPGSARSRDSPPKVARTRRSARSSSSARVPSSGTCARSSPSSVFLHAGSSARRCREKEKWRDTAVAKEVCGASVRDLLKPDTAGAPPGAPASVTEPAC